MNVCIYIYVYILHDIVTYIHIIYTANWIVDAISCFNVKWPSDKDTLLELALAKVSNFLPGYHWLICPCNASFIPLPLHYIFIYSEERPIKMRHQACISPDTKSQVYLISFQILSTIGYFKKIGTDLLQLFPSIKASNPKSFDDQINAFTRGPGPPCVVENPCGFQAPVRWWTRGKASF